ncbi:MAG: transcriptional regulator [Sedimenticola sp.]|nr:transcriptional regulator [Sedimenticola sp.]
MNSSTRKLLTIITESALERVLVGDIEKLGAHGYTITDARGKGHRGPRTAVWDESSNIRIDVVCDDVTAMAIAEHLQVHYYPNYGMILFMSDVAVLRPEKF